MKSFAITISIDFCGSAICKLYYIVEVPWYQIEIRVRIFLICSINVPNIVIRDVNCPKRFMGNLTLCMLVGTEKRILQVSVGRLYIWLVNTIISCNSL